MVSRLFRRGQRGHSGMTLTELLVAMSILLVGIYAVARGFPSLFGVLDAERDRTEMARLAEARLERLKADPQRLPEAIAGHDPADMSVINPTTWPDESVEPYPGNPRDDLTWVLGETFRVPGLQPGASVAVYPLNLGPAIVQDPTSPSDYLQVFRLQRLRRPDLSHDQWWAAGRPLESDQFFLDRNGFLFAPAQYPRCRVDYCWVDNTGMRHWVQDEVVDNANALAGAMPVRAAELTSPPGPVFANVIPELAEAKAMFTYNVAIGQAADVAPGTAVLESNFGATLFLPAEDAGQVMHVNYQLRTEPDAAGYPRRVPLMMEELAAPTQPPYQVDLKFGGIYDEKPLFENDLLGNPLPVPAYVLIVDLLSGATYTDADAWVEVDFVRGKLVLDWADPAAPLTAADMHGRELRVYYRTLNGNMITVEKAPDYFIEEAIMHTYEDPDPALDESDKVDFRFYTAQPAPGDATYTQLLFPEAAAGQAVTVDYIAGATPPFERVSGELHVIDQTNLSIVLGRPDVRGIIRVQGVSLRVRGWWHNERGRIQTVVLDTFLTPQALL
ncbi:MAG: prepilin-type N-terminal cleavage/methylation domain-containing protein [Armatimonadota bacterium]